MYGSDELSVALDERREGLTRLAAIRDLGDRAGLEKVALLAPLLVDRDPGFVAAAASAIAASARRTEGGSLEEARTCLRDALVRALFGAGPRVRSRIEDALLALRAFERCVDLSGDPRAPSAARESCARVAFLLWPQHRAPSSELRRIIADFDPRVRFVVASVAVNSNEVASDFAHELRAQLGVETDARVRCALASSVGELTVLAELFDRGDEGLRSISALGLARRGDARGLRDPIPLVRRSAVQALGEYLESCAGSAEGGGADDRSELLRASAEALAVGALSDPDARARAGAAHALQHARRTESVGALAKALADDDARVRRRAVEAFGVLGPPGEAMLRATLDASNRYARESAAMAAGAARISSLEAELGKLLSDGHPSVRSAAADALGLMDSQILVDALSSTLPAARAAAAKGLEAPLGKRSTERLVRALADDDPQVKKAAARALARHGESAAFGPLVEALAREPNLLPAQGLELFGETEALEEALEVALRRAPRHVAPLLARHSGKAFPILVEVFEEEPHPELAEALVRVAKQFPEYLTSVREVLERATGHTPDQRLSLAQARMLLGDSPATFLESDDRELVARAAQELVVSHDVNAEAALLERARGERPPGAVFLALGGLRTPRALELLLESVFATDSKLARLAAPGLVAFGRAAVELLTARIHSQLANGRAQLEAPARALAELEGNGVVELLLELAQHADGATRAAALRGLKKRRDPRTLGPLIEGLDSLDEQVVAAAADALCTEAMGTDDPRLLRALAEAAVSGAMEVRLEATRALAQLADPRAVPALVAALDDLDPEVRRDAAEGLALLSIPLGIEVDPPLGG